MPGWGGTDPGERIMEGPTGGVHPDRRTHYTLDGESSRSLEGLDGSLSLSASDIQKRVTLADHEENAEVADRGHRYNLRSLGGRQRSSSEGDIFNAATTPALVQHQVSGSRSIRAGQEVLRVLERGAPEDNQEGESDSSDGEEEAVAESPSNPRYDLARGWEEGTSEEPRGPSDTLGIGSPSTGEFYPDPDRGRSTPRAAGVGLGPLTHGSDPEGRQVRYTPEDGSPDEEVDFPRLDRPGAAAAPAKPRRVSSPLAGAYRAESDDYEEDEEEQLEEDAAAEVEQQEQGRQEGAFVAEPGPRPIPRKIAARIPPGSTTPLGGWEVGTGPRRGSRDRLSPLEEHAANGEEEAETSELEPGSELSADQRARYQELQEELADTQRQRAEQQDRVRELLDRLERERRQGEEIQEAARQLQEIAREETQEALKVGVAEGRARERQHWERALQIEKSNLLHRCRLLGDERDALGRQLAESEAAITGLRAQVSQLIKQIEEEADREEVSGASEGDAIAVGTPYISPFVRHGVDQGLAAPRRKDPQPGLPLSWPAADIGQVDPPQVRTCRVCPHSDSELKAQWAEAHEAWAKQYREGNQIREASIQRGAEVLPETTKAVLGRTLDKLQAEERVRQDQKRQYEANPTQIEQPPLTPGPQHTLDTVSEQARLHQLEITQEVPEPYPNVSDPGPVGPSSRLADSSGTVPQTSGPVVAAGRFKQEASNTPTETKAGKTRTPPRAGPAAQGKGPTGRIRPRGTLVIPRKAAMADEEEALAIALEEQAEYFDGYDADDGYEASEYESGTRRRRSDGAASRLQERLKATLQVINNKPRPTPHLEKFTGKPDEDPLEWTRKLENEFTCQRIYGLDTQFAMAYRLLGGVALAWYDSLRKRAWGDRKGPFSTWAKFVEAFLGRFAPKETLGLRQRLWEETKMGVDEDPDEYMNRVMVQGHRLGADDSAIMRTLFGGLNQKFRELVIMRNPQNLEDVMTAIRLAKAVGNEEGRAQMKNVEMMTTLAKRLEDIPQEIAKGIRMATAASMPVRGSGEKAGDKARKPARRAKDDGTATPEEAQTQATTPEKLFKAVVSALQQHQGAPPEVSAGPASSGRTPGGPAIGPDGVPPWAAVPGALWVQTGQGIVPMQPPVWPNSQNQPRNYQGQNNYRPRGSAPPRGGGGNPRDGGARCYYCGEPGHFRRECPERNRGNGPYPPRPAGGNPYGGNPYRTDDPSMGQQGNGQGPGGGTPSQGQQQA